MALVDGAFVCIRGARQPCLATGLPAVAITAGTASLTPSDRSQWSCLQGHPVKVYQAENGDHIALPH